MAQWKGFGIVAVALFVTACGADSTNNKGGNDECPAGQEWNPILARCVQDDGTLPNNDSNNASNNQASNNDNNSSNNAASNNDNNASNNTNQSTTGNNATNNGNNNTNNTMIGCGIGGLKGKTCAPSGEPLASADVILSGTDCNTGMPFEMTTRAAGDGTYEFTDVPSGRHSLRVTIGSFDSMSEVLVQPDMVTDLTSAAAKVCLDQNVTIGVIGGAYDHVEGVLEALNLDFTLVGGDQAGTYSASEALLSDLAAMNEYDIIFINCGDLFSRLESHYFFSSGSLTNVYNNLRAYVQGGKSLYIADWSAPFIEGAFPDAIDFLGDDTDHNESRKGYAEQQIIADVLTPELQAVLGRNTATIDFPQDPDAGVINNNWAIAESAGAGSTVQLQGNADLCSDGGPFNACPGIGDNQPDVPLLVTYKDPSGGTVVFTSFHNERQTALNQDMEQILRFLIFQL